MKRPIILTVNGRIHELSVDVDRPLLEVLREDVQLTGTKYGCGTGDCGTCVVEVDGLSVNSCLMLAVEADGCVITTVEGLAPGVNELHPIQQAFIDAGAVQCGYCTPGYLMTAHAFLRDHPQPTDEEIRAAFEGNLCRCTGYTKIREAILDAAQALRGEAGR
jgi:carbon-monoxide dehydrogenase small subunit